MAPPNNMASDYAQQRLENIKRNKEMIASILHKKTQLSSVLSPPIPKPTKTIKRIKRSDTPPTTTPLRRSLRSCVLPPSPSQQVPTGQFSFTDASVNADSSHVKRWWERVEKEVGFSLDARIELGLKDNNVAKVVEERITAVRFLPVPNRSIVVSGNKQGYLGIWDADHCTENGDGDSDGIFLFYPHRSLVSGISVHPSSVGKIYSSCYDGDFCLMDIEKEMFDIIHSSEDSISALSISLRDHNSFFLGGRGKVKSFDQRTGEISNEWELHEQRVNSIDIHPENTNLIATSSSDRFARIWDLRYIGKDEPKSIKEVEHNRAVSSAYFSPTGNGLASTGFDDTVRISSGPQFENLSIIKHYNQVGHRLSSFRAIWGWNDSYIFIGNMQRAVDVISTEDNIITPLQSEYMTDVPCRFATHPCKEGHLACAGVVNSTSGQNCKGFLCIHVICHVPQVEKF